MGNIVRDIKRLIREYYEQLQANKFDKLNKLLILKARKIDWIKKVENLKSLYLLKKLDFFKDFS